MHTGRIAAIGAALFLVGLTSWAIASSPKASGVRAGGAALGLIGFALILYGFAQF